MMTRFGLIRINPVASGVRGLLMLVCMFLLWACGHHQPAPVEEQSTVLVKRQLNADGSYYVGAGDTLYAIAFNYGVDPQNVAKWNGISSPYVIYAGQKLWLLKPPSNSRGSARSSDVQITTVRTPGRAVTKTVSGAGATTAAKPNTVSKTASTATRPVKTPVSATADPKSWKWPARGSVLRGYVAGDPARNGLDIAGKEGERISASSGGQVVYSGNGLIGYGELIIIKHSETILSAYAHNQVRLVKEGDQVSAGQKIAKMGRNPGSEQLLHFEIRVRGKPVNPLIYLPKK